MKTIRWIGILLLIAVIALAGCDARRGERPAGIVAPPGASDAPQPTLPPAPAGKTVVGDGQLESPYPSLPLGFGGGVSGQVLTITVKAGDTVQTGDLLALLDDTELQRAADDAQTALKRAIVDRERALQQWERDLADAEQTLADAQRALTSARLELSDTSLEEARIQLEQARQAEVNAKRDYENAVAWYPGPIQDIQYDAWQRAIRNREMAEMRLADAEDAQSADALNLETREDNVAQAERKLTALADGLEPSYERAVEEAESESVKAQEALEHARLVAPWAAIALSVDVAPQADVGAGAPVVTLLNVEEGLRFVAQNLSEQHIAAVYPGQRAIVTLRTFPETELEGTVEAVVPQVGEAVEAEARFTVRVRLAPSDLRLLPGLTGRVEIFTE